MRAFSIFISLFSPVLAMAQIKGLDVLALAKHDAKVISQEIPNGWALGFLMGTFGDPIPKANAILSIGRISTIRVHLINGTCWRNKVCEKGEPRVNDLRAIAQRARAVQMLKNKYPQTRCIISPVLEHDEKDKKLVQSWVDTVKREAPGCEVAISAFTGYVPPNVLVEKHGNKARGDITSNDGESLFDSNSSEYQKSGSVITFGWIHRFNGRVTGEKQFIVPSKRVNWASRSDFQQSVKVLQPPAPIPSQKPSACRVVRTLKDRELWKTNAEDYGAAKPDPRANKPLLISKSKRSRMDVLRPDGSKVGCVKFYGAYEGDRGYNRSYLGDCSKQTPIRLMNDARGEWAYVNDGGTCYLVNAIRRVGYFR